MTIRMPDRPVNSRRGKTQTIVVRPRGPSTKQKLLAFMAMLVLVTACGIAVIIWRKPHWLGLDGFGGTAPSPTTSAPAVAPPATLGATPSASASGAATTPIATSSATTTTGAAASASASPSMSASAKKGVKAPPPPLPAPHPMSSAPSSRL
jgi:hypothetical protein